MGFSQLAIFKVVLGDIVFLLPVSSIEKIPPVSGISQYPRNQLVHTFNQCCIFVLTVNC